MTLRQFAAAIRRTSEAYMYRTRGRHILMCINDAKRSTNRGSVARERSLPEPKLIRIRRAIVGA